MHPPQPCHLHDFVDRLTSRTRLTEIERGAILSLPAEIVHPAQNVDFVRLGQQVDYACFIGEGLVGRFDVNTRGQRQITALHIPGEIPDLHSVVLPRATCGFQALVPTTILKIPRSAIQAVADAHPAVAEAFWQSCMVDAMILNQWIVNVGRRNARGRIAHLLCEMAIRYKGPDLAGKVVYNLPLTQGHLADATGLTAIHVSRSLQSLKVDGLQMRRGTVYISDWSRLVEVAGFNADYLQ